MISSTTRPTVNQSLSAERRRALEISERLAGFSVAISSLEALVDHRELNHDGVRRASKLHGQDPEKSTLGRLLFRAIDRKWVLTGLHASRVIVGAALALAPPARTRGGSILRGVGGAHLALTEGMLSFYNRYGSDGADQATTQILAPAALARFSTNPQIQDAALWYIGIQGALSYAVAGVAKLFGREWTNGTAITGILRTNSYGHEKLWKFLDSRPRIARLLTWGTVLWEASYPLALLRIPALTRLYSASALGFHLANGYVMGLGRFAWAFAGFHPSINYIAAPQRTLSTPRHDALPLAFAAGATTAISVLLGATLIRSLHVKETPLSWSQFSAPSGNVLTHQGRLDTGDTLIVFECGLAAPLETYQWYIDALLQYSDFSVLGYERAGYGGSILAKETPIKPWAFDAAVEDLKSLIDHVHLPHQRLVLAGHSMGGEIIRRFVDLYPDVADAIVLIDSTNINQFTDGTLLAEDQHNLLDGFKAQNRFTSLGFGSLMTGTPSTRHLPARSRRRALAQERNHRLWRAAHREYSALLSELTGEQSPLFTRSVPCIVFSAESTVQLEEQRALQEQLVVAARGGTLTQKWRNPELIVTEGKHDTMLMLPPLASDLAKRTIKFLDGLKPDEKD